MRNKEKCNNPHARLSPEPPPPPPPYVIALIGILFSQVLCEHKSPKETDNVKKKKKKKKKKKCLHHIEVWSDILRSPQNHIVTAAVMRFSHFSTTSAL